MSRSPFDYVKSINEKDLDLTDDLDGYNPYLVNRALSMFPDTVLFANEVNQRPAIENKYQYLLLLNTVRRKKRYSGKWPKRLSSDNVHAVMKYYGYSFDKAEEALKVMTETQIDFIKSIVHAVSEDKNE